MPDCIAQWTDGCSKGSLFWLARSTPLPARRQLAQNCSKRPARLGPHPSQWCSQKSSLSPDPGECIGVPTVTLAPSPGSAQAAGISSLAFCRSANCADHLTTSFSPPGDHVKTLYDNFEYAVNSQPEVYSFLAFLRDICRLYASQCDI